MKKRGMFFCSFACGLLLWGCGHAPTKADPAEQTAQTTVCIHEYTVSVITEAGCATQGTTRHTCAKCGAAGEKTTDALGHSFGPLEILREPTRTTDGEAVQICALCDARQKLSVSFAANVSTPPMAGTTEKPTVSSSKASTPAPAPPGHWVWCWNAWALNGPMSMPTSGPINGASWSWTDRSAMLMVW